MKLMLSLQNYTVGIVSPSKLIRETLPHIVNILGQEKVFFFTNVYSAIKKLKQDTHEKILIFENAQALEDLFLYQDKLEDTYLFVLDEEMSANVFSAEECLEALKELEEGYGPKGPKRTPPLKKRKDSKKKKAGCDAMMKLCTEDFIFKAPNPPLDMLTVYRLEKPLTMRGVIYAFKSVLPAQTVSTEHARVVHQLLEKDLRTRLKAYTSSLQKTTYTA